MEGLNETSDDSGDAKVHGDGDDGLDASSAVAAQDENDDPIFRSSLYGMFEESQSSKTDACAVFCCGVYLWQRNRDILVRDRRKEDDCTNDNEEDDKFWPTTIPSTIEKRPLDALFLLLVAVAVILWSFDANDVFSTIGFLAVELLIVLAVWKIFRFQQARKRFRRQLAIAEYCRRRTTDYQEDENDPDLAAFLEEHKQEIYGDGGRNLFGCASSNLGWFGSSCDRGNNEDANIDGGENNSPKGFYLGALSFLEKLCCGMLCGCNLQLCGMCAIAQESRHLRDALPTNMRPGLWQRDYITMQPWKEYYPSILRLRLSNQIHCLPHFKALSRLSRRILIAGASVLLFVTFLFLLPIRFPKWQVLIVS